MAIHFCEQREVLYSIFDIKHRVAALSNDSHDIVGAQTIYCPRNPITLG